MRDFDPLPGLQPLSPPSLTGDGLIMAAEIGAAIRRIQNNLNLMLGFTLVPDEPGRAPIQCMAGISEMCSPHTMVVNRAGERFADESYFQSVVPALRRFDTLTHAYVNLPCWLILTRSTSRATRSPICRRVERSGIGRARTICGSWRKARDRRRRADAHRRALQRFCPRRHRRGFSPRRAQMAARRRPAGATAEQPARRHRECAVLRARAAPESRHVVRRPADQRPRAGAAPAPASHPGPLCVGSRGRAAPSSAPATRPVSISRPA